MIVFKIQNEIYVFIKIFRLYNKTTGVKIN